VPKHIGIVAVSPEGSAFCYRMIGRRCSEVDDPARRPVVTLHNKPFSSYVERLNEKDWEGMAHLLIDSARVLNNAGADFCVLPDNVAHHALQLVEGQSPVPFLNMIELVADAVQGAGCSKIGLIGTQYVMSGSTYQTVLGLRGMHLLVPEADEAEDIDSIIFNEAIYGSVRQESKAKVMKAIMRLGQRGCDAVVLGSSEASLLMAVEESPLPVFDPVELLADSAVRWALQGD